MRSVWLPHCWSGAIGIAATLQLLAVLPDATFGFSSEQPLLEHDTLDNPFREELVPRPFRIDADSQIEIPRGPGLGIEVDESIVRKYLVR